MYSDVPVVVYNEELIITKKCFCISTKIEQIFFLLHVV